MKRLISVLVLFSLIFSIWVFNSCKKDPVVPTLTTSDVSNITVSSLTSGGNISKDGGAGIIARGVCYGTSSNPLVSGFHTTDDVGTGSFVSNVTGLTPNTLYHIRAYATNKAGTAYGNEVTATTVAIVAPALTTAAITSLTLTSAVSGGNITSDGNDAITARGVCWATTTSPTVINFKTTDGTGTGTFTSNLTGLIPATKYYVRAYATNSVGTAYGNEISFTTSSGALSTLTTAAISVTTSTSAVSGGNITADGGTPVTARGICWATTTGPTTANFKTINGTGTGAFTSNLTGLTSGSTYYVRAYATNSAGTAYGNERSFIATILQLPTLTTAPVTSIALTSAVSGGSITSDGGAAITASGICWSTTINPTINNSETTDGTTSGIFVSYLTGLTPGGTTYYVRAYATNSQGTAYGNQQTFNTILADLDGNSYKTVTIGTQVWMVQNLKTTKYNDGTAIPNVTDNTTWSALTTGAYCDYSNTPANSNTYGRLYNWYAVASTNPKNICPTGWHVPTDAQMTLLVTYLGGESLAGGKLKETGITHWLTPNASATNETGFTALPGGYRDAGASFGLIGNTGFLWTSSISTAAYAWYHYLYYNSGSINSGDNDQHAGFNVRCLKD